MHTGESTVEINTEAGGNDSDSAQHDNPMTGILLQFVFMIYFEHLFVHI